MIGICHLYRFGIHHTSEITRRYVCLVISWTSMARTSRSNFIMTNDRTRPSQHPLLRTPNCLLDVQINTAWYQAGIRRKPGFCQGIYYLVVYCANWMLYVLALVGYLPKLI
jgi:hypothetical protein